MNMLIKHLLLGIVGILFATMSIAQPRLKDDDSYTSIRDSIEQALDSIGKTDPSIYAEGGAYSKFIRWKNYYDPLLIQLHILC